MFRACGKVLGDGQSEQYIETIPKRGYRFVAGVKEVWKENGSHAIGPPENGANGSLRVAARSTLAVPTSGSNVANTSILSTSKAKSFIWPVVFVFLGVTATLAVWSVLRRSAPAVALDPLQIVPVTSFAGNEDQAAFSVDGNQIAFVWNGEKENNADIYVKMIGAETPLRLTTDPAVDNNPAWSPDGRYIAFIRQTSATGGVFLVPALGGPERRLADAFPYRPVISGNTLSYSPDGKYLVLPDKHTQADPFSIFSLTVETGDKVKITSPPPGAFGDLYPAFSPDQNLLAFVRSESIAAADIYLMAANGGDPKRLTFDHSSIRGLSWTSDGREIVFASRRRGSTYNLWKVSASGGEAKQLMTNERDAFSPTISREQSRLAYTQSLTDGNIWRLALPRFRGPNEAPVKLVSSTQEDSSPNFSPDGKQIAFASRRSGSFEIWVCASDGSSPRQLTNIGGPLTGTPRWSPDGSLIAFDSWAEGNPEIYVMSAEGGKPRRLTDDRSEDITPSWSRDGQWIYFSSTRGGSMQIWKAPSTGGPASQVTKLGGFEGFESVDGKYFFYAKGRAVPGIWRVPVSGGEETLVVDSHQAGLWRYWALADKGIYFATAEVPSRPIIEFFNFATRKISFIARLDTPLFRTDPGLAIAPDGQSLLIVQMDQSGSDIMLAENLRKSFESHNVAK